MSLSILQRDKFREAAIRQIIHIMRKNNVSDAETLAFLSEGYNLNHMKEIIFLLKAAIAEKAIGLAKMLEEKIPAEYCADK